MDAITQIIVLLISYIYGFFFYYFAKLNNKIIKTKKKIYRSITSILFMYNIVLIYIIIIYKINNGIFHIYLFFMIILGFFSSIKITKRMKINVKLRSFIAKMKSKCYTKKNRGDKNKKESY